MSFAKPHRDFGLGFYTTTSKRQAEAWAYEMVAVVNAGGGTGKPGVVEFIMKRGDLAGLDSLSFVQGDFGADDFWSLVFHCRSSYHGYHKPDGDDWYDLVVGPVAGFWRQRVALQGYDQTSFHTDNSVKLLNGAPRSQII